MSKNTIGQFIAALRKTKGMTQQEVANRLNVSNKAVSRWERDECAPDLSLIPAIAEMFGVTCDELLKGERILEKTSAEKKEPRVEKQIKNLLTKTLSDFKKLIWISLANAVVGLVCMFGISYGFYRPIIGFAVMLLFEVCAFVITILAVSQTKDIKNDNELFESAEEKLIIKFNNQLGNLSFASFFVIIAVVLFSLPLILITSDYIESVVTVDSYFTNFFGGIVLILVLVYFLCKKPYIAWITNSKIIKEPSTPIDKTREKLTLIQVSLTVIAGVLFIIAPYFDCNPNEISILCPIILLLGVACLLANIISFFVFFIKKKEERNNLIIPGLRNMFLIPAALIVSKMHITIWRSEYSGSDEAVDLWTKEHCWYTKYLWYALAVVVVVLIGFSLFETLTKKNTRKTDHCN